MTNEEKKTLRTVTWGIFLAGLVGPLCPQRNLKGCE